MLTLANYLNHRREETQKQSSGPDVWYMVLLWEKAIRRLEKNVMSYIPRDAVLCFSAMVMAKSMRRIKVVSEFAVNCVCP